MSLGGRICFEIARYRKIKEGDWGRPIGKDTSIKDSDASPAPASTVNPKAFSCADYTEWRDDELREQYTSHFKPDQVAGKDVLDFGCGYGALSYLVADMGASSVTGIDVLEKDIEIARSRLEHRTEAKCNPEFVVSATIDKITLPSDSFDVILCFDVLEHIMEYEKIIPEWKRILRPGGKILIWWQPHFHPYAHHLHNYLPIPWAHVFFSDKSLAEACTRIYNAPGYNPRFWDLDPQGNKRKDKIFDPENLGGINDLTIGRFEKLIKENRMQISRREIQPFTGPFLVETVSGIFSKIPKLREYFTACVIYEINKLSGPTDL